MADGGPPDVTHLSKREGLEVLRSYRKQREAAKEYDFSLGPPDVADLEGSERLAVLRKYRQWLQARDEAFEAPPSVSKPAGVVNAKKDDAPTPRERPQASVAPWLKDDAPTPLNLAPLDISDDAPPPTASKSAGLSSGAHGSMYTYFERPVTARDSARVPPTVQSEETVPPSPRASQLMEAAVRAEAMAGAAGVQSTAGTTAWLGGWLENDTPRNCRRLVPKEDAFEASSQRIFAPDSQPDEALGQAVKSRAKELLEMRQQKESEVLATKIAQTEAGRIAGVATALAASVEEAMNSNTPAPVEAPPTPRQTYTSEYTAASLAATGAFPPSTPRTGTEMPSTVGMSRAAVLEAKRAWRLTLKGESVPSTPRELGTPAGTSAGMSSEYRSRTVRGQVPALDPSSAAEYNLQVKLAKGADGLTPRGVRSVEPWLGGGEQMVFPARNQQVPDISDDMPAAGAPLGDVSNNVVLPLGTAAPPTPNLAGLSHTEKLKRMRQIRQESMDAQSGAWTPRSNAIV